MGSDLRIGRKDHAAGDVRDVRRTGNALAPVVRLLFVGVADQQKRGVVLLTELHEAVQRLPGRLAGRHRNAGREEGLYGIEDADRRAAGIQDLLQIRGSVVEAGNMLDIDGADLRSEGFIPLKRLFEAPGGGIFL